MGLREDIQRRIDKKQQEIGELESWARENEVRLRESKAYVQGLLDILKLANREEEQAGTVATLRPGTMLAQARDAILQQGKPLRLELLLKAMGKPADRKNRAALGGSLSAYVRRKEVFTRPAPNTFGLVELGHDTVVRRDSHPPASFGQHDEPDDDERVSTGEDGPAEPGPPSEDGPPLGYEADEDGVPF